MSEATPLSRQVAAEVRAHLARAQVRSATVAQTLDLSVTATNKRLNGSVPFSVDELALVAALLDVDVVSLIPKVAGRPAA